jgi:hypothetical protein
MGLGMGGWIRVVRVDWADEAGALSLNRACYFGKFCL